MAKLTTHILDTAQGAPAGGVAVRVYALGDKRKLVTSARTSVDGRAPLLDGDQLETGAYELEFDIGDYFRSQGLEVADPPFLGIVPIRVNLQSGNDYHVPLLASPWSYATYRGS